MPAASPESRIKGSAAASAQTPPTTPASTSEETLPVVRSRRKCARLGMIAGFSAAGTDSTPAVQAPIATKLMCPNETTPELPTKTYSPTTIATLTSASVK